MNLPDHARENKAAWEVAAAEYVEPARRDWAAAEISWGMYEWMTLEWARRWPVEDLWTARRAG